MRLLSLSPVFFACAIAFVSYLFFYWRRLKEDYTSNLLFASGIAMIVPPAVATLAVLVISKESGYAFWSAVVIYAVSFFIVIKKYKIRGFESFEASGIGLLAILLIWSILSFLSAVNVATFLLAILPIISYLAFVFLDGRYKRFTWYSSGRVGFAGCVGLLLYFLMRSVVVVFAPSHMVSFSESIVLGKLDLAFCGIAVGILTICIYALAKGK